MQYTEEISPWKETQTLLNPLHLSQTIAKSHNPRTNKLTFNQNLQLDPSQPLLSPLKAKFTVFQPVIVAPQLLRSRSIKETTFQTLPKFHGKRTSNLVHQKNAIFTTNELISLAKSYSKELDHRNMKKVEPSPRQLKAKVEVILKQESSPKRSMQLLRSNSQLKAKSESTITKEKNIIFMYVPHSQIGKDSSSSPKKKGENHILDKLLEEWK